MGTQTEAKQNWLFQNMANLITAFGLILCLALLWAVVFCRENIETIFILVVLVLLSDFLDGQVARYLKVVSKLGAALDRLRDKLFQFIMFMFFLLDPRIDPILKAATLPLLVAEILLLTIWFMGVRKRLDVSSSIWGKVKMFLLSMGIIACPLIILIQKRGEKVPHLVVLALFGVFAASFLFAIMSFIKHLEQYRKQLS